MHWRPSTLPELAHLPQEERRRILRASISLFWWVVAFFRCGAAGVLTALIVMMLVGGLTRPPALGPTAFAAAGAAFCFGATLAYRLQLHWLRKGLRAGIVEASAGDRTPMCLRCGYDLAGHESDSCPECGAKNYS